MTSEDRRPVADADQGETPLGGGADGATVEARPSRSGSGGEWIFCAILAVVACVFLVISFGYPFSVRLWPLIAACLVIGLIAIHTVHRLSSGTFLEDPEEDARAGQAQDFGEESSLPAAAAVQTNERATVAAGASFVLFVFLIYAVGFLLAGAIFVTTYMIVAGYRRPLTVACVTLGISVAVYLLFGSVLNAPLTEGAFLEYDLTWLPV